MHTILASHNRNGGSDAQDRLERRGRGERRKVRSAPGVSVQLELCGNCRSLRSAAPLLRPRRLGQTCRYHDRIFACPSVKRARQSWSKAFILWIQCATRLHISSQHRLNGLTSPRRSAQNVVHPVTKHQLSLTFTHNPRATYRMIISAASLALSTTCLFNL